MFSRHEGLQQIKKKAEKAADVTACDAVADELDAFLNTDNQDIKDEQAAFHQLVEDAAMHYNFIQEASNFLRRGDGPSAAAQLEQAVNLGKKIDQEDFPEILKILNKQDRDLEKEL